MNRSRIKPLENRVVVEPTQAKTSKGGILLPESSREKPREGTIIAVGPGKHSDTGALLAMALKEGDRVAYSTYSGTEFSLEDREYLILSEDDVLGTLN